MGYLQVTIMREDEDYGVTTEYPLEVWYNITPDEYEGDKLFSRGGIELEEVLCNGQYLELLPNEEDEIFKIIQEETSIPSEYYPAT